MDAARSHLIEILQALARQLAAGEPLPACLRRLPRGDLHALSAPLAPRSRWRRPWPLRAATASEDEAWLLARLAVAAGGEAPERLARGLAELARDLARRSP